MFIKFKQTANNNNKKVKLKFLVLLSVFIDTQKSFVFLSNCFKKRKNLIVSKTCCCFLKVKIEKANFKYLYKQREKEFKSAK